MFEIICERFMYSAGAKTMKKPYWANYYYHLSFSKVRMNSHIRDVSQLSIFI